MGKFRTADEFKYSSLDLADPKFNILRESFDKLNQNVVSLYGMITLAIPSLNIGRNISPCDHAPRSMSLPIKVLYGD